MHIRPATPADVPLIRTLIEGLASYERLRDECVATDALLHTALFGARPYAEVVIAEQDAQAAGFALFFHNFSTFLARPGIYLEDLFVVPAFYLVLARRHVGEVGLEGRAMALHPQRAAPADSGSARGSRRSH